MYITCLSTMQAADSTSQWYFRIGKIRNAYTSKSVKAECLDPTYIKANTDATVTMIAASQQD